MLLLATSLTWPHDASDVETRGRNFYPQAALGGSVDERIKRLLALVLLSGSIIGA
jgi:hypothetical protein